MRRVVIPVVMLAIVGLAVALMARRQREVKRPPAATSEAELPALGSTLTPLPEGSGKAVADQACLICHSGDILRQQRLTEKQWGAVITKMIGWGAELSDEDKATLLPYLTEQFGAENRFEPIAVRPIQP